MTLTNSVLNVLWIMFESVNIYNVFDPPGHKELSIRQEAEIARS